MYLYLRSARPSRRVFRVRDVDNIPLGVNFVEHLKAEVGSCDVLLALIGPDWLDMRDERNRERRRLDSPTDFVRVEIATALERNIPVIPILVRGTKVPSEDQLTPDLKNLAFRAGFNHDSFPEGVSRLVHELKRIRSIGLAQPTEASRLPADDLSRGAPSRRRLQERQAILTKAHSEYLEGRGTLGEKKGEDHQSSKDSCLRLVYRIVGWVTNFMTIIATGVATAAKDIAANEWIRERARTRAWRWAAALSFLAFLWIFGLRSSLEMRSGVIGTTLNRLRRLRVDIPTTTNPSLFPTMGKPRCGTFVSSDGRFALSGSEDHTLKVWDLKTLKEIRTLTGHLYPIHSVAISRDGRLAISAGDGEIKLWDMSHITR